MGRTVRCMGGNLKFRALRLDSGNFSWGTEVCTRKTRVLDVSYNASNNELVRTKTLVKGAIVVIDASPFAQWYESYYGVKLGKKGEEKADAELSKNRKKKFDKRSVTRTLEPALESQFLKGRLFAKLTSRPGQVGRCDGSILEGPELTFYTKMMQKK